MYVGIGVISSKTGGVKSTVTVLSVEVDASAKFPARSDTKLAHSVGIMVQLEVACTRIWNCVLSKGGSSETFTESYAQDDVERSISHQVNELALIGAENTTSKYTFANDVGSIWETFWFKVTLSLNVSISILSGVETLDSFQAISVTFAVISFPQFVGYGVETKIWVLTPLQLHVQTRKVSDNSETVLQVSEQDISKLGVVSEVLLSLADIPVSDEERRSGIQGADGRVVSTCIVIHVPEGLSFQATSISFAVIEFCPSGKTCVIICVEIQSHVPVQTLIFQDLKRITELPFSEHAVSKVGVVSLVILSLSYNHTSDIALRSGIQGADGGIES